MKLKFYPYYGLIMLVLLQLGIVKPCFSQTPDCSLLTATYSTTESRCTATGTLQINASGGSGTYNYKVSGPSTIDFTSSSLITGLQPGTYTITVKDIISLCTFEIANVIISGSYSDPRFGITETDVTCNNGNDGTISVSGLTNGLAPFTYTLVAPSPSGVGTTNSTGSFTGLIPGSYAVQLMDSCGGIQTRSISIQNYTWSITSSSVTVNSCSLYHVQIGLTDSKGNTNASGTAFNGFSYGVFNAPGDTSWFSVSAFDFDLAQRRSVTLLVKDRCGAVKTVNWSNTAIPSVAASVSITLPTCTGFNAAITGQQHLTSANYCLVDNLGNPVPGHPCNSTGGFANIPYGSYCINITNTCYDTVITRCFSKSQPVPVLNGTVAISNYTCTTVNATVTGTNLYLPQFCLFDNLGNAVGSCNTSGIFSNIAYGAYTVKVTDGCAGTVLNLNFNAAKKTRSVAAAITVNGYTCTTFNATVTGATNLNTPQYCLVDNLGNPVTCNATGIFTNLAYGAYCVNITDACGDTTIQRCMNVTAPPLPTGGSAVISNKTCSGFTVTVTGQANIFNGQYCLQDNLGNPVTGVPCNATGIFTNIPYGSYCVKTTDGCSGTAFTSCFTVAAPVPSVGAAVISNQSCSGFTATLSAQTNLTSPSFCLYDNLNNQIGSCNSTGVFNISSYGSYYIKTTDGCAGAVFTTNFSVTKPVASIGPGLAFYNQTCTTFSTAAVSIVNLANAQYYLIDKFGNTIANNLTGVFDNVLYGQYCVNVVSACADTTIQRCFTTAAAPTNMNITATPSCTFNASDISIHITAGFAPFTANVYDTLNNLLTTGSSATNYININGLPALIPGQKYKIVVSGSCGTPATQYVIAQQSSLTHVYSITPKCPSSIVPNGSADLQIVATTSLAGVSMQITQKNFSPVSIGYSFNAGNTFTFNNLDAATYVITYSFTGCSTLINDTVSIPNYTFPSLARSGAYQCDNNNFSVGAAVSGGIGPFSYQVIGSEPALPSINSAPQSNPVFLINNGVQYSLVRLRAIDACGNAALNDVSILPLANTIVTATSNCIYQNTTLSTDPVPNATYIWYKKTNLNSTDSIIVGTDPTYNIPAISVADTGIYVNRMSVNSGCLTRLSYFHLDGMCNGMWVLPVNTTLRGKNVSATDNQLTWLSPAAENAVEYVLERSDNAGAVFEPIATFTAGPSQISTAFNYTDNAFRSGSSLYRLRITSTEGKISYSNIVLLKTNIENIISVYPNPVTDELHVDIRNNIGQRYVLAIYNVAGQILYTGPAVDVLNSTIIYRRDPAIKTGMYFLKLNNLTTGESNIYKIMFK